MWYSAIEAIALAVHDLKRTFYIVDKLSRVKLSNQSWFD